MRKNIVLDASAIAARGEKISVLLSCKCSRSLELFFLLFFPLFLFLLLPLFFLLEVSPLLFLFFLFLFPLFFLPLLLFL